MYLLEKWPGPKTGVRYREVSAIWDVRYREVLLYKDVYIHGPDTLSDVTADGTTL